MTALSAPNLDRILEPVGQALNVEAARKLVKLRADAKTQRRIDQLARKCNEGKLTATERSEYESWVFAIDIIAILQAKARAVLARTESR